MQRNRILFLTGWVLSLVCISFYGGPVSYGLFFLLTFLPVVSLFYLLCVLVCLRLYQEIETRYPVAAHPVPFFFTLVNEFPFGFVGVRVGLFSSFSSITGLDDGVQYELHPGTSIRKDTTLICRYRGEYEVGIKEIVIEDYFRLIRLHYRNRETMRLVVRPDLIELSDFRSIDLKQFAGREKQGNERPDVLVREYESGDDVRLIHWPLSAGTGKLQVRKSIGEEQNGITILLGTQRMHEHMREYLPPENKMLETVLALSLYLVREGIPVRTVTEAGRDGQLSASSIDRFDAYYQKISGISFKENTTEKELLLHAGSSNEVYHSRCVLMILQALSVEALQLARLLNDHQIPVAVFCITHNTRDNNVKTDLPRTKIICIDPEADLREVL